MSHGDFLENVKSAIKKSKNVPQPSDSRPDVQNLSQKFGIWAGRSNSWPGKNEKRDKKSENGLPELILEAKFIIESKMSYSYQIL